MVTKTRTSVYQTSYHLVFVTKYRKDVFTNEMYQKSLKNLFYEIAKENEISIQTMEVMSEHVHLLISFPPKYSISVVVKKLKGVSARRWFQLFPETKDQLWNGHLWHGSYFVSTTGKVSSNIVSDYIKNQKNQPPSS